MDPVLAAGYCADDEERLFPCDHLFRQRGVRRLVGQVLLAREEAHEGAARARLVVADGAAERRVARFERVEDAVARDRALDFEFDLALDARQRPERLWEEDADHGSACASTES